MAPIQIAVFNVESVGIVNVSRVKTRACGRGAGTSIHEMAESEDDAKIELAAGCRCESVRASELYCDAVKQEEKLWQRTLWPDLT